jgi:GNAT superfamily N-acetyltransferase
MIKTRHATPEDYAQGSALLAALADHHACVEPEWFEETLYSREWWNSACLSSDTVIGCAADGEDVVGVAVVQRIAGEVPGMKIGDGVWHGGQLVVRKDRRGDGVGEALWDWCELRLRRKRAKRVVLANWTRNPGAGEFYKKVGCREIQTVYEYVLGD